MGSSRGGKNTKIHTLVDGLGNPLAFLLSSGNDHDSIHAIPLLKKLEIAGSNILGDKAYGAQKIRDYISEQNALYTIPPKDNNPDPWFVDWHTYKERHLVECFFQKIKWFRRISTRYAVKNIIQEFKMNLQYRKATPDDAQSVFHVVRHTKDVIYLDYYTRAVIEYVDRYYTLEIIKRDIEQGRTRVLVKNGEIVGTGSRTDNHIMRVYVLPEFQGQGFGSVIMDELEKEIFEGFEDCELEASLPACIFYENRGYKTVKHVKEDVGNGKCMIYEIMRKVK